MKLAKELLAFRRVLLAGLIVLSIGSNYAYPRGLILAEGAFVLFLLLVIVYLFDTTWHSVERHK